MTVTHFRCVSIPLHGSSSLNFFLNQIRERETHTHTHTDREREMSLSLILKMIIHERTSISASSALWAHVIQVKLRYFFPRVAGRYSSLVIPETFYHIGNALE